MNPVCAHLEMTNQDLLNHLWDLLATAEFFTAAKNPPKKLRLASANRKRHAENSSEIF